MLPDATKTGSSSLLSIYHHDEGVNGSRLVVQLLFQHQDAAPGVQVEELGAVLLPAVDGEHQLAVGVSVLGGDLQDVLPGRRVLRNPHLQQQPQLIDGVRAG